jgi:hypothetical protein
MFEDSDDYNDDLQDEFIGAIEPLIPKDGLILHVMNKCGELEDMVIGLQDIKKYINKVGKK